MKTVTSLTLREQAEQIANAYGNTTHIGAPSLLGDADKMAVLLAAIADGNYRETACKLAGISKAAFYNWLKRAEAGEEGAIVFVDMLEKAEAFAESETVKNVRNASKMPQFWAAGMTWLERKSPEKWGKRNDEGNAPKVIVQFGVRDSDVSVTFASPNTSLSPVIHSLTEATESDK